MKCTNVTGQDYETEYDLECSEVAIYLIDGEPRCNQCAHEWLDEVHGYYEHSVKYLGAPQPAAPRSVEQNPQEQ